MQNVALYADISVGQYSLKISGPMPTSAKEAEYRKTFDLDSVDSKKAAKALEHALDIRKFEIELYWKRATYFWTLIAATFAGYFAVLASEKIEDKLFNAYVIACIGLVFTLAWFLVNRGSKFWQENWENHVDMLEDPFSGPLYKTVLHRPETENILERFIDGPAPISVSKVNQWVSLFTLFIWPFLIYNVLPPFSCSASVSLKHVGVMALVILVSLLMLFKTASNLKEHRHSATVKRTSVIDD